MAFKIVIHLWLDPCWPDYQLPIGEDESFWRAETDLLRTKEMVFHFQRSSVNTVSSRGIRAWSWPAASL